MEAVAAGNNIGRHLMDFTIALIPDLRPVAVDALYRDDGRFVDDVVIFICERCEQIAGDFLLAIV